MQVLLFEICLHVSTRHGLLVQVHFHAKFVNLSKSSQLMYWKQHLSRFKSTWSFEGNLFTKIEQLHAQMSSQRRLTSQNHINLFLLASTPSPTDNWTTSKINSHLILASTLQHLLTHNYSFLEMNPANLAPRRLQWGLSLIKVAVSPVRGGGTHVTHAITPSGEHASTIQRSNYTHTAFSKLILPHFRFLTIWIFTICLASAPPGRHDCWCSTHDELELKLGRFGGPGERDCLDTYKLVELSRCLLVSNVSILKFNPQQPQSKVLTIEPGNSTSLATLVGQGKMNCLDTYKWWELLRRLLVSYGLILKFNPGTILNLSL